MNANVVAVRVRRWIVNNVVALSTLILSFAITLWANKFHNSALVIRRQIAIRESEKNNVKKTLEKTKTIEADLNALKECETGIGQCLLNFAQKTNVFRYFLNLETKSGLKLGNPTPLRSVDWTNGGKSINVENSSKADNGHIIGVEYRLLPHGNFASIVKLLAEIEHGAFAAIQSFQLSDVATTENRVKSPDTNTSKDSSKQDVLALDLRFFVLGKIQFD
jgi:hypothetical protein